VQHPVLYRPADNKVLAGVCSGVAQRLGVDPNLVRIAAVVLAFFGGIGVAAYLTGLAVMPRTGDDVVPISKFFGFTKSWPYTATAVVTFVALMIAFGFINGSFGVGLVPVAIIGFIVYRASKKKEGRPLTTRYQPTPFEQAATAWKDRVAEHQAASPGLELRYSEPDFIPNAPQPVPVAPQVPAVREPKRHGWLVAFFWSIIGIAFLLLLTFFGITEPSRVAYAAVICLGLGAALLWTAPTGRPKAMLPVTIAAVLCTGALAWHAATPADDPIVASALPERIAAAGSDAYIFTSSADFAQPTASVGDLDFDFRELELTADQDYNINVTAWNVHLVMPADTAYDIRWKVKVGNCVEHYLNEDPPLVDVEHPGFSQAGSTMGGPVGEPKLTLNVDIGTGNLEIEYP
jgi:phage shock protein PspC (stress-responsive transcriptional regulator)